MNKRAAKEKRWFKLEKAKEEKKLFTRALYTRLLERNAYHQSETENALILMENLYRNEIKCRMLFFRPKNGCFALVAGFQFFSRAHSNKIKTFFFTLDAMLCAMATTMMTHANCRVLGDLILFYPAHLMLSSRFSIFFADAIRLGFVGIIVNK